jgi:hypothetical protein
MKAEEAAMKYVHALMARFGLFAPKSEAPDLFAMRLQRIGNREARRQVRSLVLFKGLPQLMEA